MLLPSLLLLLSAAPETPAAATPHDFVEDALVIERAVGCIDDAPLPKNFDADTVEKYCKVERERIKGYRAKWGTTGTEFLAKLKPAGLPDKVVYPFGGGDLLGALATYPEAKEITTLSLEFAGDPRRIKKIEDKKRLEFSLQQFQRQSYSTLTANDNLSSNMSMQQKDDMPGQLALHLLGLAVYDMVPTSVKFFRLEQDGSIHYMTDADIAALENTKAQRLHEMWANPNFSPAFTNVEIAFVPRNAPPGTAPRIHRHLAANLSDEGLTKHPEVLKHLAAKGQVSAMTKAASYLMWREDFSKIREYLLGHMEFMISDSTGIPPRYVNKAGGFVQETYGEFEKPFLEAPREHTQAFVKLYASQPKRALPVRYGYPDGASSGHSHMIITKKAPPAQPQQGLAQPGPK